MIGQLSQQVTIFVQTGWHFSCFFLVPSGLINNTPVPKTEATGYGAATGRIGIA